MMISMERRVVDGRGPVAWAASPSRTIRPDDQRGSTTWAVGAKEKPCAVTSL
ncbi:hypothetical protein ACQEVF_32955 [Nonomuraea polychroma]|uniref:hypothetical protein n=1 Tax=Nonomuraea polychroma TaxID=46176 RepID=UPI003D906B2F